MSLTGKTIKGQGGGYCRILSTRNFPVKIEDERKLELLKLIREGSVEAKNELILGHVRLAVSIVDRYIGNFGCKFLDEELDDAAIVGIVVAVNRIEQGHLKHDNVTGYIVMFIHNHVSSYLRKSFIVPMPRGHPYKRNISIHSSRNDRDKNYDPWARDTNPGALLEVKDLIDCSIRNEQERRVVDLKIAGYTDKEVAKIMDMAQVTVFRIRQTLKTRFERLNRND